MSDERLNLSENEEAALRAASQAWVEKDRTVVSPRERVAQLRAAARLGQPAGTRVSRWPAAAVAILVIGMSAFVLLWSRSRSLQEQEAKAVLGAEADDNKDKPQPTPAPEPAPAPLPTESLDKDNKTARTEEPPPKDKQASSDAEWKVSLKKDASVHVENGAGDVRFTEVDGDKVVVRAHKRLSGLTVNGANIHINGGTQSIRLDAQGNMVELRTGTFDTKAEKPERGDDKSDREARLKSVEIGVAQDDRGDLRIRTINKQTVLSVQVDYDIGMPKGVHIGTIRQDSGNVVINGGNGNAEIVTMSGDITVKDFQGVVTARSANGLIDVSDTSAVGAVESMSGDVRITNVPKVKSITTTNGAVRAENIAELGPLATMSGDIAVKQCGGALNIRSTNGDIKVQGASTIKSLDTMSGEIEADIGSLANNQGRISAVNGTVVVHLVKNLNAKIHAEATNGRIESFVRDSNQGRDSIGAQLDGMLGQGAGALKINTMSGDITILPLGKAEAEAPPPDLEKAASDVERAQITLKNSEAALAALKKAPQADLKVYEMRVEVEATSVETIKRTIATHGDDAELLEKLTNELALARAHLNLSQAELEKAKQDKIDAIAKAEDQVALAVTQLKAAEAALLRAQAVKR